ncbi:MAG: hypothetical protein LQ345_003741 [Seirophora villosa]|nr:MAG: hypothetical protein LQ345_003741 [Seirophora villosa]
MRLSAQLRLKIESTSELYTVTEAFLASAKHHIDSGTYWKKRLHNSLDRQALLPLDSCSMALQRRARGYLIIEIPIGGEIIQLPKQIIKAYLPDLWRRNKRRAMRTGLLRLPRFGVRDSQQTQLALLIILHALEASATESGVASELKAQLDLARDRYTLKKADPEFSMCIIFWNVATLLQPRLGFGRHQEMAYAMSGWFTDLAAEGHVHERTLVQYVLALDQLEAEMTAPLLCLLRRVDVRLSAIREWSYQRRFRPATLKKMESLVKSRPRMDALGPSNQMVLGGDLHLSEILEQYKRDPDAILVNFGPKRHRRVDNGYYSYSDSDSYSDCDYDEGLYTTTQPPFSPYRPPRDPVRLEPRQCGALLAPCERPWNPQPPMNLIRSPSAMLLGAPGPVRPGMRRYHTTSVLG